MLLNAAKSPIEMDVAGWKLHQLKGELSEHWAHHVETTPLFLAVKLQL